MRRACSGEHIYPQLCSLAQRCGKDPAAAKWVHSQIVACGYGSDRFLGNLVVQMYGGCGRVEDAMDAFRRIQQPNVFSWAILAAALLHSDRLREGREVFSRMPQHNVVSTTAMLAALVSAGLMEQAMAVFASMKERNAVTWTALVTGFSDGAAALEAFGKMPQWDCVALNAMLAANAQEGYSVTTKDFFDRMLWKNEVSWNTILDAFSQRGLIFSILEKFWRMPMWTIVSWNTMIAAFARVGDMYNAKKSFDTAPERDMISWNSLLEACSNIEESRKVFDLSPKWSSATWSSMIVALVQSNRVKEGVELLLRAAMELEGFHPEPSTLTALLTACATTGSLEQGRILHEFLGNSIACNDSHGLSLASVMLRMYSECGCLEGAELVFSSMPEQDLDLVAWSSMICAYAHHGQGERALDLFRAMSAAGVEPDDVVFVSIISACSHSGLLHHSRVFFHLMAGEFSIAAGLDQYKSIVDALGRAGMIELALELLQTMPFFPDRSSWTAFLGACNSHRRNVSVDVELEGLSGALYVLLANSKLC
ncbi:pentatricopeptide repeat-containing protein At1g56690, mitochondrial [Selaginella moellendorffii]|uniref:pentatricopeptide repeat-containing protein At1g56690, mitochondrial n=1 Tax=Selaginella moellendorffii TaxID=88036 RepID=UPI000D1C9D26|nr:pentatricopeptide repeat-containing protein At1g56690, mitochondrial [Selaginella moellendorffii]|eukprot:XP_024532383.1 pentatricopeptide repeat-containing protein At1g56690, mitochondrial [Selaginella moellendorffii]